MGDTTLFYKVTDDNALVELANSVKDPEVKQFLVGLSEEGNVEYYMKKLKQLPDFMNNRLIDAFAIALYDFEPIPWAYPAGKKIPVAVRDAVVDQEPQLIRILLEEATVNECSEFWDAFWTMMEKTADSYRLSGEQSWGELIRKREDDCNMHFKEAFKLKFDKSLANLTKFEGGGKMFITQEMLLKYVRTQTPKSMPTDSFSIELTIP